MRTPFEKLVKQYQDKVYTFAHYYLGHRQEAEDVTQEVLIRLWRHLDQLEASRIEPWLITVTRNACLDSIRRRQTYRTLVTTTDFESDSYAALPDQTPGPLADTESGDFEGALATALSQIAEPYKSILVLREIQDLKYEQISDTLSLPLNTVKCYLHRGRAMLRENLKPLLSDEEP